MTVEEHLDKVTQENYDRIDQEFLNNLNAPLPARPIHSTVETIFRALGILIIGIAIGLVLSHL